ncbi:MAG: repair protein RecO protein [Candidatus Moranbacteria bacterium GW2011_GWE1_36_7]|nr:MAG: repair protein RecO protein [Candidatus Moranbacteria bacterium GW2011_GWD2_36_12]KKQ07157.1 MAG: repair protein RecO protein [Candidatus Moranbacteria bacterium GW2011_GWE2_36_40]KKQ11613.1 MAG: repair protein RecO protein [Candidatus Moranbacteria bacterium GW2011_GWE1_36_7]
MEYKYTGIILNKRDAGETDRICTIYTLEGGKIRSLAKGVRKAQAKLAASLENITLADITIVRARGLGKITGSIVENNFSFLKQDIDALTEAFGGLAIFDKMVDYEHPDDAVFVLLKEYLEAVEIAAVEKLSEKQILLRLGFTIKLLDSLGYALEVDKCVACGGKLNEKSISFNSRSGGVLCGNCPSQHDDSLSLPISSNAIKMIRLFLANNMATLGKIKASRQDYDSVRLVVDDFLRWTL